MKTQLIRLILLTLFTTQLAAQNFSERKILIDNLGAPIGVNGVVFVEDMVYCNYLNNAIHFISHFDGDLNLFKFENGKIADLGSIGELGGFIVEVFDHNEDGLSDILGNYHIKLGLSDSTFGEKELPIITGGSNPYKGKICRVGDVNGDGVTDILTRELVIEGNVFSEKLYVYILNPSHRIIRTITFIADEVMKGAQVFDHDLDGDLDLVYVIDDVNGDRLVIGTNIGTRPFWEQTILMSDRGYPIITGDFDNDKDEDILITGAHSENIEIVSNDNGVFADGVKVIDTEIIFSISSSDLNADGNLDIVYLDANWNDSLRVMVALGTGRGGFESSVQIGNLEFDGFSILNSSRQAAEGWVSLTDYDMDGDIDVLVNAILEQKYLVFENEGPLSSVSNNERGGKLLVYPNPASTILNVDAKEIIKEIEIWDIMGRLLIKTNESNEIPIGFLNPGWYILKATDEQGQTKISLFAKENS